MPAAFHHRERAGARFHRSGMGASTIWHFIVRAIPSVSLSILNGSPPLGIRRSGYRLSVALAEPGAVHILRRRFF